MCANQYIMNRIVRGKEEAGGWGFDGFVSSDCDSVQTMEGPGCPDPDGGFDPAKAGCTTWPGHHYSMSTAHTVSDALRGGTDTNCGYASYRYSGMKAFDEQLTDTPLIDQSVRRTMKAIFQLGLFDPPDAPGQWTHGTFNDVGTTEHKQLALEAAQQSLVLLQNPAKVLPLPRGKRIVVLGPHFNATSQLLGNYRGDVCWNPGNGGDSGAEPCMVSLMQAITAENQGGETVGDGVLYHIDNLNTDNFTRAIALAKTADLIVLALGLSSNNDDDGGAYADWGGGGGEGEGTDRSSTWSRWTKDPSQALGLPGAQEALFGNISAIGKPTAVVLINGGQVAVDTIAASNASLIEAFYPGQSGAAAIASVLFGTHNPSGKLDQTIYAKSFATEVKWWDTRLRPHAESLGRTHMFYTGQPLYKFGFGLSYSTFELSWSSSSSSSSSAAAAAAVAAAPTVTLSLDSPDFATEFQAQSFSLTVQNTGKLYGRETVMAYWMPPSTVADQLQQQLFNFSSHWLEPGATTSPVTVQLPPAVELASVDEFGDRLLHPGTYTVQLTRGYGAVLNATVVLTGSAPKLLRSFPRQWGVGSQMALDWCVEQGLDVTPHSERDLAKQWRHAAKAKGQGGKLIFMSSDREELCLTAEPLVGHGQATLQLCSPVGLASQLWSFGASGLSAHNGDGKQWWLRGPALGSGSNFTTLWSRLRVPLQLSAAPSSAASEVFHWQAPDAANGFIALSLDGGGSLDKTESLGKPGAPWGMSGDKRLCLTAQSNTVADAP